MSKLHIYKGKFGFKRFSCKLSEKLQQNGIFKPVVFTRIKYGSCQNCYYQCISGHYYFFFIKQSLLYQKMSNRYANVKLIGQSTTKLISTITKSAKYYSLLQFCKSVIYKTTKEIPSNAVLNFRQLTGAMFWRKVSKMTLCDFNLAF